MYYSATIFYKMNMTQNKRTIFHYIILLNAALLLFTGTFMANSFAADCKAKAGELASSRNGKVLSVSTKGSKCKIKLLIKTADGPPKQKVFVVQK